MADPNDFGALWIADDKPYDFSGFIGGVRVVIFRNTKKSGKQPDYRVLKSTHQGSFTAPVAPVSGAPDHDDVPF